MAPEAPFLNLNNMKDRIKQIMDSQHMTQQEFAAFIGIAPATLSNIFNDKTRPSLNIVEAIKKKIPDINTDWLMFGSGEMYLGALQSPEVPLTPTPSIMETMLDLDFSSSSNVQPTPVLPPQQPSFQNGVRNTHPVAAREELKNIDKPLRHVTEIRVYYDDQTWESFVPSSSNGRR